MGGGGGGSRAYHTHRLAMGGVGGWRECQGLQETDLVRRQREWCVCVRAGRGARMPGWGVVGNGRDEGGERAGVSPEPGEGGKAQMKA